MFKDLPKEDYNVETKFINQNKLDIDEEVFLNNDIIIIQSGTGTGKTKCIAKKCDIIVDDDNKIITMVNLISLACEQIDTFKKESNTTLKDYRKIKFDNKDKENIVICINSLYKMLNYSNEFFENYVFYIDEINNLIQTLTHNQTVDKNLNLIYAVLIKIIKNCKKVILSDAIINQNVFNLLSTRKKQSKTILIRNEHKKYKDIEAIQYLDKNDFYNELKKYIEMDDYFLFGCDICALITNLYNDLLNIFKDKKDKFILITSETQFRIKDATGQFKNKFVFYSPSITTGINYLNLESKQTQFLYLTGESVKPDSAFQMASRTRNIRNLKFHIEKIKPKEMKYKNIDDVSNSYEKMIKTNDKLLNMCFSFNTDDEIQIIKNTFFKLFVYNEYIFNIYDTDYEQHFNNILKSNGFKLKTIGIDSDFELKTKSKLKKLNDETKLKLLEEFISEGFVNENLNDDKEDNNLTLNYELYLKRCEIIGLSDDEFTKDNINKYSLLIQNDKSLNNYLNFQKLLYSDELIVKKLNDIHKKEEGVEVNCKKTKCVNNIYTKISLLKNLENTYKFERFNFDEEKINVENSLNKDIVELINTSFRFKKTNLKTKRDVLKLYVNMINTF